MEPVIVMAGKCQRSEAALRDIDAKLLRQLTYEGFLRRLTGLHLAAWKLPKAAHMPAFGPLGDKNSVVLIDERTGNYK